MAWSPPPPMHPYIETATYYIMYNICAMCIQAEQSFNMATRGDTTVLGVCSDNQVAQFVPASSADR